jgi:hypothetical protein
MITIIMFLDIIHRLVFCLKCRPVYISKHDVSETGFYLRPRVKPTQLSPLDRGSPQQRGRRQKKQRRPLQYFNHCINTLNKITETPELDKYQFHSQCGY